MVLDKTATTGLAIDESTAFLIQGKTGRVIGPTQVLIIEKVANQKLAVTVLESGQTFQIK